MNAPGRRLYTTQRRDIEANANDGRVVWKLDWLLPMQIATLESSGDPNLRHARLHLSHTTWSRQAGNKEGSEMVVQAARTGPRQLIGGSLSPGGRRWDRASDSQSFPRRLNRSTSTRKSDRLSAMGLHDHWSPRSLVFTISSANAVSRDVTLLVESSRRKRLACLITAFL